MQNIEKGLWSERKNALTAGTALMVMALAALFSNGFVLERLVMDGDAITTFSNIKSSITLFNAGIIGWLIILITDVLVSWSLYLFLKPVDIHLSLLASWLRMIYACILGIAIMNLVFISILTNRSEIFPTFKIDETQTFVMFFLMAFHRMWSIGLIIFGGHLMCVGYVTFKSYMVPKVISILLLIASVSYIIIHFIYTFLPQFNEFTKMLESILSIPMFLGELSFGIWLLVKGGRVVKK